MSEHIHDFLASCKSYAGVPTGWIVGQVTELPDGESTGKHYIQVTGQRAVSPIGRFESRYEKLHGLPAGRATSRQNGK